MGCQGGKTRAGKVRGMSEGTGRAAGGGNGVIDYLGSGAVLLKDGEAYALTLLFAISTLDKILGNSSPEKIMQMKQQWVPKGSTNFCHVGFATIPLKM